MTAKTLRVKEIIGIDLSNKMLEIGRMKVAKQGLSELINLEQGDSENLRFDSDYFDAVTVAFGVRNFEDLKKGLAEMHRVTRPDGQVAILEFSVPKGFIFNGLYKVYSRYIMPFIGRITSGDASAYTYLYESVQQFPHGQSFINILTETGFKNTTASPLFGGICTIYKSTK